LGPGVMIPSLRHPMVTASAIATLVSLVGESRVVVGVGAGFTVTDIMGPSGWHDWHAARAVALAPSRDVGQQQNERRLGNGRRHCFVLAPPRSEGASRSVKGSWI